MRESRVTINGERFSIAPNRDLAILEEAVLHAVRVGGELVDVSERGDRSRRVLVTAASSVKFEYEEVDSTPMDDDTAVSDWFELQEYGI